MVAVVEALQADRRPVMNVPRQVLDAFEGLVANEEKKRTAAAMLILQHVDQVLRGEGQGKEMPVGVKYIVQRLVSGLASTRLSAREGYFSALCFLLRLHPSSFTPAYVLSLLTNKKSSAMKAVTKDEIRDQLLAELLLCGAVVRSGQASRGREVLQRVVNQLCAMRTKKSYLDITATQFLVNLMENCEGDTMHEEVWESLQAELQSPVAELSPSQLWMRLILLRKHRASPPVWLTSTLAPKHHEALGQTLMKTTDLPKVHPVLEELVSSLAASRDSSSSSLLVKFWRVTVEPLQGNTSPGKLQILFHFLRLMVPHLRTAAEFKEVVTPSVVALLLNSLTQSVNDLKEAARGVTAAFVQLVKDNQDDAGEVQLAVVRALVTLPGSVRFDQLAGHKVLALMVPHFTLKTLKGFTKTLLEVVNKPAKDSEVANRNYASHTLGNLLAQPRACTPEAATWKKKQLMALLKAVVLMPGKEKEGDTTKDAFFKALGKQVGHIKEYKGILLSLVEEVDRELKALEAAGSPSPLSDTGKEQWSRVNSRLVVLKGKKYEEGTEPEIAKTVFQVLYCQMALHLFVDVTVATESIEEFITCHKEVMKLGMLKGDEDEDEDDEEEEDEEDEDEEEEEGRPGWVEVVTELLLSLMTQEMHLFRSVVQGLFWLLTPLMTATALSLLTDVLDTEKAQELVKKEGEEEGDDNDKEKEGSDDDTEDSDDDEKEEEEAGEGEDPNLFTLKKKMLDAAGGIDIDVDVDMDSVPQEELDRLDERLGALLAEYRGKHPTRKKKKRRKGGGGSDSDGPQLSADEQSLMHFQTRVCDMLIVYIKAAPNMALQVGLVNPIFKALRMADLDVRQNDLQNKLANVITALEKKKKFNTFGDIDVDSWKETVSEFFSFACQLPEKFVSVAQSCYSQLMHCGRLLLGIDEEMVGRPDNFLTTTYISHLETFFTRNHHLPKVQPFCEPCTYNMGGLWRVAATLVRLAFDPEVKVHKQAQALKTLQQLYGNKVLIGERSRQEVAAVEQDLYSKVLKVLGSMQSPINGLFVSNLLRLLHTILQVDRRTDPQPSLPWEELRGSVEAFRERISKTALKAFRREYNVFTEVLRGLLSSKKSQKKQGGGKRGAAELNEDGNQQENQMKKRKKENKKDLTNNTDPLSVDGGKEKKDKKKDKKNKKNLLAINEDNEDTPNKENSENTPKKIMVNGDDNKTFNQGQENEEKIKKKKKKDKLAKNTANSEESKSVPNQEENVENKKKKKKKDKLMGAIAITEESSQSQTQDNHTEERKVGEGNEKKSKKNKLEKRKQKREEEEETAAKGGKELDVSFTSTSTSTLAPESPPKKKKKKKSAM